MRDGTNRGYEDGFSSLNPIVSFVYFAAVLFFGMTLREPVCLAILVLSALWYGIYLNGRKAVGFFLKLVLPMSLLAFIVNPLFSHEGATIISYFPNGNPLTYESIMFGASSAAMFSGVMCLCYCLNAVLTSDKITYLFGRVSPALSLLFCMTVRFVPLFAKRLKSTLCARETIGRGIKSGRLSERIRNAAGAFSIVTTWSLENAVVTSDSMKARGYGKSDRTCFSPRRFTPRDAVLLVILCSLTAASAFASASGKLGFRYYPTLRYGEDFSMISYSLLIALYLFPVIINLTEDAKWRRSK